MVWGEESDEQGVLFRDILMPQGIPDPQGEKIETKRVEPTADPQAPTGRAAPRTSNATTGKQVNKRQLRPRHKDVVKKYFDSKPKQ